MLDGYLNFGGNEVANNARTLGYARTASCPMAWFKGEACGTLWDALGETVTYTYANISSAPWYDTANPESGRFFGVFVIDGHGEYDSTRKVGIVEGISDGGVLSAPRKGARDLRVKAVVGAQGLDALEYGMAWLSRVLDPGTCGQHGTACGTTDLAFFNTCPPPLGEYDPDDPRYVAAVTDTYRFMHDTATVSGPLVVDEYEAYGFYANVVEFVFTSERPHVFKATIPLELPPGLPVIVQDIPYNLALYPSAELTSGTVTVATNYVLNPSAESSLTNRWGVVPSLVIPVEWLAIVQTTEIKAQGTYSAKVTMTAAAAGSASWFGIEQYVTLTGITPTTRYSVNLWANASVESGTAVIDKIEYTAYWMDAASVVIREDTLGFNPAAGGAVSVKSILPPAGTTKVLVRARAHLTSWSAGAKVRLFGDAMAVTTP